MIVPATAYFGFSYEVQTLQYKEAAELPRKQGLVLGSVMLVIMIAVTFDAVTELPWFQYYYYIIFPGILIIEYFLKTFLLKFFENELMTLPARLGIKVTIFIILLNCYKFHLLLLLSLMLNLWQFFYSGFVEKYNYPYVFEYIRKSIEKRDVFESSAKKHFMTYAVSELCERSLNLLLSFIAPVITLFVCVCYDLYSFNLSKTFFWYFLIFEGFLLCAEPFKLVFINFVRILRDSNYCATGVFELASLNYKQRIFK